MRVSRAVLPCLVALVASLIVLSGCATERDRVQSMEQLLGAAGFRPEPADTAQKQLQLATLPPHKLLVQKLQIGGRQVLGYVYADPDVCHCVFVGDARAYQTYEQLAYQKKLADEYQQAAAMAEDASFNWDLWAPGFWVPPPPPVVVVRPPPPPPPSFHR